ncbi:MAG TPA: hypothetical protein DER26_02545 [Verrucomicrobia bacterium]|nr:hypothetical protein [Verrucomicrobiota bacterium]
MKTYVCGHRNPDVDSAMSAYALADLRRRTGSENVEAICAGRMPDKARWVFDHFGLEPLTSRRDVYVRAKDLIDPHVPVIDGAAPLSESLRQLETSGESSLPVRDASDGMFLGMLSPVKLLGLFLAKSDLTLPTAKAPLFREGVVLSENDRVYDIRRTAVRDAHNHFPVVSDTGVLRGTILKRAFAEEPPYRMILVDHNETAQGIPGVDEIPIIEVVDHHRISFAPTREPIRYMADAVGSTCTLVTRLYRAAGLRPTKEIAGVLIAGIVADTLLFQSPTTTAEDRTTCAWLEKICGEKAVDIMKGLSQVDSPLVSMPPEQAVLSDAKCYNEGGRKFLLAQIEESNFALFHQHQEELSAALEKIIAAQGLDFAVLMVTDPLYGNSELLYRGSERVRRMLPYRLGGSGTFLMPGVLSRKKQLLPAILAAVS